MDSPVQSRLRPHQTEAVEAAVPALDEGGRATVVMACGTGKTRVAAEASRRLAPAGRVLVVVPTLELLYQTAREWRRHLEEDTGRITAVCSEKQTLEGGSTLEAEELEELEESGVLVSTSPEVLHADLKPAGRATVFVTYASLPVVAALHAEHGLAPWDLMVIDEAHRSAGAAGRAWSLLHRDREIPAHRRLYMTATPRIYTGDADDVVSMDDEAVYGPCVYRLGFSAAIEADLLADYRLLIAVVTHGEVAALTEGDKNIFVDGLPVPARMLAAQIALGRAIDEFDLRATISYHSSIAASTRFAQTLPNALDLLGRGPGARPVFAYHVDGTQSLDQRRHTVSRLADPQRRSVVVSNCRVLSEGIDVPELDAVMFASPRDSGTDVVQALGRALRRGRRRGGKTATIIVPVLTGDEESAEAVLEGTRWQTVWRIVRALRTHDDRVADELDNRRALIGRGERNWTGERTPDWAVVSGRVDRGFAEAVQLRLVEATTSRWWQGYAAATDFHAEHGHLDVPHGHIDANGFKLGSWVSDQRSLNRRGDLAPERAELLEQLGISWEPEEQRREDLLREARAFRAEHGHLHVPTDHVTESGYPLGNALRIRRQQYQDGSLAEHWIADLDALGMPWERSNPRFWDLHARLRRFHAEHGHVDVPYAHTDPDGVALGKRMRRLWHRRDGEFTAEEQAALERLGGWGGPAQIRRTLIEAVRRFHDEHGHVDVPAGYVDAATGARLRGWLDDVAAGTVHLTGEQRRTLRSLGADISPRGPIGGRGHGHSAHHEALDRLEDYREEHGHVDVPAAYVAGDGYRLGAKLAHMRASYRKDALPGEVIARAEELGVVWNPRDKKWQEFLAACDRYLEEHGDLLVPVDYVSPEGYPLGSKIVYYRQLAKGNLRGRLSLQRRAELERRRMRW